MVKYISLLLLALVTLAACQEQAEKNAEASKQTSTFQEALPFDQEQLSPFLLTADSFRQTGNFPEWILAIRKAARAVRNETGLGLTATSFVLSQAIEQARDKKHPAYGKLLIDLGYFLQDDKDYFQARKWYEKAREFHETVAPVVPDNAGEYLYKPLANIYTRLGEIEKARQLLQTAMDSISPDNRIARAQIYNDLAKTHQDVGDYHQAIRQLNAGIEVLNGAPTDEFEREHNLGLLFSTKANCLAGLGQLLEAEHFCQKAIRILPDPCIDLYLFSAISNLADIFTRQRRWLEADQAYQRAEANFISCGNPKRSRELGKNLLARAELQLAQGKRQQALHLAQEALGKVLPGFDPADDLANPIQESFYPENTILEALELKSDILWEQFQEQPTESQLAKTTETLHLAAHMLAVLRDSAGYQSSKLLFLKQSRHLYQMMLDVAAAWKELGQSAKASELALDYMERSRAVLLRQKLAGDQALATVIGDQNLRDQEKALLDQRISRQNDLLSLRLDGLADTSEAVRMAQHRLSLANEQYLGFLAKLEQNNSAYYRMKNSGNAASLEKTQQFLQNEGSLLVEYFYEAEDSSLYILGIMKGADPVFVKTTLPASLIQDFIEGLTNPGNARRGGDPAIWKNFALQANQLFGVLLKPVWPETPVQSLVIVPDGLLSNVPFDLLIPELPQPLPSRPDYAGLPYLFKKIPTRLALSTSLLVDPIRVPAGVKARSYLGVTPAYTGGALPEVKAGQTTIPEIAREFHGRCLPPAETTVAQFRQLAPGFRIIHFFGHSKTINGMPDYSWMAFTRPRNAAQFQKPATLPAKGSNPGLDRLIQAELPALLFAHELYGLRLNAELVVLNACESGTGDDAPGEGVMSIARAFHAAGAPNTVMGLWPLEEKTTAWITRRFFEYLLEKKGKAEALRLAKIDYLTSQADHGQSLVPYYWAGIALSGDNESLSSRVLPFWKRLNGVRILGGISLLALSVWAYRRSKKQRHAPEKPA